MKSNKKGPTSFKYMRGSSIQVTYNGTGTAVVDIEVSNNRRDFFSVATLEISRTDGLSDPALRSWKYIRLNIKSINSGEVRGYLRYFSI